ncbi:ethanolamine ammonia-lyase light chain [mine drainage metagenome]|uniref:Ethanolamine ammonia-lyase light chain n=1 Tax=mine drainage metagenome TaxID=410659 RepID=A0A1J5R7H1_9ZZZZ
MSDTDKPALQQDPWSQLRGFTRARIALGRVGSSLPTKEVLGFGLSHAMARDAVHLPLDVDALEQSIQSLNYQTLRVQSRATDRASYLLRPDLGRRLHADSLAQLQVLPKQPVDFLIVVGDGLSSLAVSRHVAPLLDAMRAYLPVEWNLGTIVIASQARVAIADEVAEVLGAKMVVMLIGERPGLSSPDSLGVYLTFNPHVGCSDADRNCISNVRPEGLVYDAAAKKLLWLAKEALRLQVSGVVLKDESDAVQIEVEEAPLLK